MNIIELNNCGLNKFTLNSIFIDYSAPSRHIDTGDVLAWDSGVDVNWDDENTIDIK